MKAELRADGTLSISGYVNVPGRESRPVMTSRGKVIEIIEQRAFERAIEKVTSIDLKVDHEKTIASTSQGNLTVYEDAVGLRAEAVISDEETIIAAKEGKIRGWSFNMANIIDKIEERANQLPIRRVKDFVMTEITLAIKKNPVYSSTSLEIRANNEEKEVEVRATQEQLELTVETPKEAVNYTEYETRINNLKKKG